MQTPCVFKTALSRSRFPRKLMSRSMNQNFKRDNVKEMAISVKQQNMNPCLFLAFCYNWGLLSIGFKGSYGLTIRLISVVSGVQLPPPLPYKTRGYGVFRSLFSVLNPCLFLAYFRLFSKPLK